MLWSLPRPETVAITPLGSRAHVDISSPLSASYMEQTLNIDTDGRLSLADALVFLDKSCGAGSIVAANSLSKALGNRIPSVCNRC